MEKLWVQRVPSGERDHPWKPDVPQTSKSTLTRWACLGGIPTDKIVRKLFPDPITNYLHIWVPEGQGRFVAKAVDPVTVPERDKLITRMMQDCGTDYEGKAEEFFDSIPSLGSASAELRETAKMLLEQARARGLSEATAETIRSRYDLPELASVGR